ncbi:MarR family winged helix-turn-helix transcriptional regulator [Pseudodesulfovibrio sediminis]|uniref:HTH marR-type domain-containing protein n=1 Tax=Pseudodesulfovibrio sediminis TaxID=2810563 RepID=A0ABM8HZD3_9BACT|nr:MarR family transcriptional regulator [Pseudodesulfovibrio sediminis]BCS89077.1 hypothetical protein PSDVSF_23190 [Pseudodesulfovibrio sediminis]
MAQTAGLTLARWQALRTLSDTPRTVSSMARELDLARQSVQRTVNHLEKAGYVKFTTNPEHATAKLIRISTKGVQTLETLAQAQRQWLSEVSKDLPPANLRISTGMLRGLLGRLNAE